MGGVCTRSAACLSALSSIYVLPFFLFSFKNLRQAPFGFTSWKRRPYARQRPWQKLAEIHPFHYCSKNKSKSGNECAPPPAIPVFLPLPISSNATCTVVISSPPPPPRASPCPAAESSTLVASIVTSILVAPHFRDLLPSKPFTAVVGSAGWRCKRQLSFGTVDKNLINTSRRTVDNHHDVM